MEHVVSTTALVFPTTCRNYYDPYQQKSMAPSMKTYTISNEIVRKPKKIDGLNILCDNSQDFQENLQAPDPVHPVLKSRAVPASSPVPVPVSEVRLPSPPAFNAIDKRDIKTAEPKAVTVVPLAKPLKPILKPAPAILTDTQAVHRSNNSRSEPRLPAIHDASARFLPSRAPTPDMSPSSIKSYKSTDRIIPPRLLESMQDEKSRMIAADNKSRSIFSFTCLRPRKKSKEKPASSFRVLNTRLSAYDDHCANPIPTPPKPKHYEARPRETQVPRYKFLYPKVPENIPGTAGVNSFTPISTRIPTPGPKSKKAKLNKKGVPAPTPTTTTTTTTTTTPSPLPPRRVVKKLSSHLSRHPAVRSLMTQYPTVEMYEKRTGFDTYFDTPFIEYSHSYWTSLNRPPSPVKRTKPLKVKFDTPVTKPKRVPTPGPGRSYIETYGPKRDLGTDVNLVDEYSYPYSPDDYEKTFPFGFARDSIEEVALLGGRRFSSSTERPRQSDLNLKLKPRVKTMPNMKVGEKPHVRFLSPTPSAIR